MSDFAFQGGRNESLPRYFDTHAHLSDEAFDHDLPEVLENCREEGVDRILLPASDWEDSLKIAGLLDAHPDILWGAVGVHPHAAASYSDEVEAALTELLESRQNIVALGEIGLDYHYDFSPRAEQRAAFRRQLDLAHRQGLPVILHDRDAHGDCLEMLQQAQRDGILREIPGVLHCYSGSAEMAEDLLKMGFYLGFDGPITFKNARKSHEVLAMLPHDRLLLETDSPYLAPVPYRGKRNDPSKLPYICAQVAEIWRMDVAEVAEIAYQNALRVFARPIDKVIRARIE